MARRASRRRAASVSSTCRAFRIEHLSDTEQRVLRLAINRLGETGDWSLEALKIELEELILADALIEISGFTLDEVDQITLGDGAERLEEGPLEPEPSATPISRLGDVFQLGPHRITCADATDPEVLHRLMGEGEVARLVLTDEPYNVPIAGNVTKDPFLGSGSTLIAADKTGRVCRGVELDPLYVDVIARRCEAATGNPAVLIETGEVFDVVAAHRSTEAAQV